jgi:hypothetical protein
VSQPMDDAALEEYRKAQAEEYGTWIAAEPINAGTALAYNAGDPVPASNVDRLGYADDGRVVKRSSAAGRKLLEELGMAPEPEPATEPSAPARRSTTTKDTGKS